MTADLNALFDTFTASAFRLETLPAYQVGGDEAERLAAFREYRPRPERSVRTSPWLARIARTTAEGKTWQRVRIVDDPLTEYQRYQLESYRESQAVGEEIRIAERFDVGDLGSDFWLFDADGEDARTHAMLLRYDQGGRFDRADVVRYEDDPELLRELNRLRLVLAGTAIPLNSFLVSEAARV